MDFINQNFKIYIKYLYFREGQIQFDPLLFIFYNANALTKVIHMNRKNQSFYGNFYITFSLSLMCCFLLFKEIQQGRINLFTSIYFVLIVFLTICNYKDLKQSKFLNKLNFFKEKQFSTKVLEKCNFKETQKNYKVEEINSSNYKRI